jgi:gamma-glutamyltranspeptidase / glutathione hydrolase
MRRAGPTPPLASRRRRTPPDVDAVGAPRVHHPWMPDELRVERGVSPDTIRPLQATGYTVVAREASGSANTIGRSAKGVLTGASDPRQHDTLAIGY